MKLITIFLLFANITIWAQSNPSEYKVAIDKVFKAQKKHTYTIYLGSVANPKNVKLVLRGTDYDYDNDGDYTDFRVTVNGTKVIDIEALTEYGLGKNGNYASAQIDISNYIKSGTNTIELENTENSNQVDYVYLSWLKILTQNNNNSTTSASNILSITPLEINIKKPVYQKFKCQTRRAYTFQLNATSNYSSIKLALTGYDVDYDKDGDFTEGELVVNGTKLFTSTPLKNKGLGSSSSPRTTKIDITAYIKTGTNTLELANTEISGQTDYFYITALKIMAQEAQKFDVATISLQAPLTLNRKFDAQNKLKLSFYNSSYSQNTMKLNLYGTDIDADNDGDFTDMAVSVNNKDVLFAKSLTDLGLGKDGMYKTAEIDITQFLKSGNNEIILQNTETKGQIDYTFIKSLEIKEETINQGPEIAIYNPDLTRGFKVIQNNLLTVEGKATDPDGILSVTINNTTAQLAADGSFTSQIPVNTGDNPINVVATDLKNTSSTKTFSIKVDNTGTNVSNTQNQLSGEGKFYAFIIGVSDYADPQIPDLNGEPTKDAEELYNLLTQKYTFNKQNVKLLKNPTYRQIIRSFDDFAKKITENDNFLIFYAGHGDYDEKNNIGYWLPADAEIGYTDAWLYNSVLVDNIKKINSKHTLLLADACFSGSIFQTRSLMRNASVAIQKKYELKSRNAITSGTLKTVPNKSIFFKYLSDRLSKNKQKYLSASELFRQIEIPVGNNSPNMPQFGDIKYAGDEGGDFIFIKR